MPHGKSNSNKPIVWLRRRALVRFYRGGWLIKNSRFAPLPEIPNALGCHLVNSPGRHFAISVIQRSFFIFLLKKRRRHRLCICAALRTTWQWYLPINRKILDKPSQSHNKNRLFFPRLITLAATWAKKKTKAFKIPWIKIIVTMSLFAICLISWPSTTFASSRPNLSSKRYSKQPGHCLGSSLPQKH